MKNFFTFRKRYFILISFFTVFTMFFFIASSGGKTGVTNKNSTGCTCHGPSANQNVMVSITGPDVVQPNSINTYTATIQGGPLSAAGIDIAVSKGVLNTSDGSLRKANGELTHSQPKTPVSNMVTFNFNYTAPATVGPDTIFSVGNSVDLTGGTDGDSWNFSPKKIITVQSQVCKNVNIATGWNIVSVPVTAANLSRTSLFANSVSQAFSYDNGYQSNDTLRLSKGFWIKYNSPEVVNICGTQASSLTIPVNAGWNLIGIYDKDIPVGQITSSPAGIVTSSFFAYDNGYQQPATLITGKGFWVKTSQAGTLQLPALSALKSSGNISINEDMNFSASITISDNSGFFGKLHLSDNSENFNKYELPPQPPGGISDIRFSTNRYVESSNGARVINLNSLNYPVKIKSNRPVIIKDNINGSLLNTSLAAGSEYIITDKNINSILVENIITPNDFTIEQNYPNPFNPSTSISFSLPQKEFVSVEVYDINGEKKSVLMNQIIEGGKHSIKWNASQLPSGIYFITIKAGEFSRTIKSLLLK